MASDAPDEDHDGGYVEESGSGFVCCLGVLPEPSVAADPREEALDSSMPRLHRESHLVGLASDNRDGDGDGLDHTRALIADIGEDLRDEGGPKDRAALS